jgi:hypothetical protein
MTWDGATKNSGKSVFDVFPRRSPWSAQACLRLLHREYNRQIKAAFGRHDAFQESQVIQSGFAVGDTHLVARQILFMTAMLA